MVLVKCFDIIVYAVRVHSLYIYDKQSSIIQHMECPLSFIYSDIYRGCQHLARQPRCNVRINCRLGKSSRGTK